MFVSHILRYILKEIRLRRSICRMGRLRVKETRIYYVYKNTSKIPKKPFIYNIYIVYQVNQDSVGRITLRIIIFDFSDISELDQRNLDLKEATECREDW